MEFHLSVYHLLTFQMFEYFLPILNFYIVQSFFFTLFFVLMVSQCKRRASSLIYQFKQ